MELEEHKGGEVGRQQVVVVAAAVAVKEWVTPAAVALTEPTIQVSEAPAG